MKLKVQLLSQNSKMPVIASAGAACFDIHTTSTKMVTVAPGEPHVFNTGLAFEIPSDHVMLIFSRSGHGFQSDIRLSNCVGVIDADYRGELKIKLAADRAPYVVTPGERIAQAMIIKKPVVELVEVSALSPSDRGANGFGSTGKG